DLVGRAVGSVADGKAWGHRWRRRGYHSLDQRAPSLGRDRKRRLGPAPPRRLGHPAEAAGDDRGQPAGVDGDEIPGRLTLGEKRREHASRARKLSEPSEEILRVGLLQKGVLERVLSAEFDVGVQEGAQPRLGCRGTNLRALDRVLETTQALRENVAS